VYVRYFWQGNLHTYGHTRFCVYTVLADSTRVALCPTAQGVGVGRIMQDTSTIIQSCSAACAARCSVLCKNDHFRARIINFVQERSVLCKNDNFHARTISFVQERSLSCKNEPAAVPQLRQNNKYKLYTM